LFRSIQGYLTAGKDGYYDFASLNDFAAGHANSARVALSRTDFENGIYRPPVYDRSYRQREAFLFAQDSFRVNARVTLNFGLRYENFGAPVNAGTVKDPILVLDNAIPLAQALPGAKVQPGHSGDQPLYSAGDWSRRGSLSLRENARTLLRALRDVPRPAFR
jgi:outer membrane receptor protein involved in Fe transport